MHCVHPAENARSRGTWTCLAILVISAWGTTWSSTAAAQECFPSCRPGFVCSPQGQCVSACNPPCDPGQQCTDAGACTPIEPAQPPHAQPPHAQPPHAQPPSHAPAPTTFAAPPSGPPFGTPGQLTPQQQEEADAERARLRAVRSLFHVGFYGAAGVHVGHLNTEPSRNGDEFTLDVFGPSFDLGISIRQNFVYQVGYQFRFDVGLGPIHGDFHVFNDADFSGGDFNYSGFHLGFHLEGLFKIGPFAQRFPMYLDFGGHLGVAITSVTPEPDDFSGSEEPPAGFSHVDLSVGPSAGIGFVFGDEEQFDLGVRGRLSFAAAAADSGLLGRTQLMFGYSFI
jgi:hypothetical protein